MVCVFFGILAFVSFILTDHSVAAFTALGGTLVGLAGWYHNANVKAKQSNPGEGTDIQH
jgi:membrane associated rhomboid family serine protease